MGYCQEWSESIKRDLSRSGTTWSSGRWGQAIFVTSGWRETSIAMHSPFCTSLMIRVKVTYVLNHKAFGTEPVYVVGRDSSVGIATRYGLDGPGIEYRCEGRFSAPVQTDPGTNPASYKAGTGAFPGVKRPRRGVDQQPHLLPRLKKEKS
jgi:hypothetical protein